MNQKSSRSMLLALIVFSFLIITLFLYRTSVSTLYFIWVTSEYGTYKHGLLLLVIGIYFFYEAWKRCGNNIGIQLNTVGVVVLGFSSVVWFLAGVADIRVIQQVMLIWILFAVVWSILGHQSLWNFSFPFFLLICATPIWGLINEGWLQNITASMVTVMLGMSGINAYLEEGIILIPAGTFNVEASCSGMQQLISSISIAAIYAYINRFQLRYFILFLCCAAVLAFIINVIRIFIVVVAGQLTNMKHYLVTEEHISLGWVLFGVGIFGFILLSNKLLNTRFGSLITFSEYRVWKGNNSGPGLNNKYIAHLVLVFIGLSIGPLWAHIQNTKEDENIGSLIVPSTIEQWKTAEISGQNYQPFYYPGDESFDGYYSDSGSFVVYCHIRYYKNQKQGKELISYTNQVYDDKNWLKVSSRSYEFVSSGNMYTVQETLVKTPQGNEKLIWHWYYIAGKKTVSAKSAKLLELWAKLSEQTGSSLFLLAVDVPDSADIARDRLRSFFSDSMNRLEMAVEQLEKT